MFVGTLATFDSLVPAPPADNKDHASRRPSSSRRVTI
jgi:hypothetical protein